MTGPFAEEVLKEVNIDITFLGVNAFNPIMGAAANHEDEAKINRQMVQRSKKVVVVADSSKFTHTAFATICAADQINTIITDSGTDEKMLEELCQLGIEIIIA